MPLPSPQIPKMVRTFSVIIMLCTMCVCQALACLNTYQFKTFPVGIVGDQIITVDVQVMRTEAISIANKLDEEVSNEFAAGWILYTYSATYTQFQKLVSVIPVDTVYVGPRTYLKDLQKAYKRIYESILTECPSIRTFTPKTITFCDFQSNCQLVAKERDSLLKTDFLKVNDEKYEVHALKDTTYYAIPNRDVYFNDLQSFRISSVRVFETKGVKLMVCHLERGNEIGRDIIPQTLTI